MTRLSAILLALAVAAPALAAPQPSGTATEIQRNGSAPSRKGPAANFTGPVRFDTPFAGRAPAQYNGAFVTFEPGSRTFWHSHPMGQTLVITAGCGWVQDAGGQVQVVRPGDVVWTPPGVKHWHGAAATNAMTHITIAQAGPGQTMQWSEAVSEADYKGPAC